MSVRGSVPYFPFLKLATLIMLLLLLLLLLSAHLIVTIFNRLHFHKTNLTLLFHTAPFLSSVLASE